MPVWREHITQWEDSNPPYIEADVVDKDAPRIIYGPRGETLMVVTDPSTVPFGFQRPVRAY